LLCSSFSMYKKLFESPVQSSLCSPVVHFPTMISGWSGRVILLNFLIVAQEASYIFFLPSRLLGFFGSPMYDITSEAAICLTLPCMWMWDERPRLQLYTWIYIHLHTVMGMQSGSIMPSVQNKIKNWFFQFDPKVLFGRKVSVPSFFFFESSHLPWTLKV